jgi:hypothetical protein
LTCRCGYQGYGSKMSFDVDEAYLQLMNYHEVYTIRPIPEFPVNYQNNPPKLCHIHRGSRWNGHVCQKTIVAAGIGDKSLRQAAPRYASKSGFPTADAWIDKLISMHGGSVTTMKWGIFRVVLVK